MIRRRLIVTGHVQGVWYRAWMAEQAAALGVAGWVRNRADGSVEALVEGPDDAVPALVARCRDGPPAARVADVAVNDPGVGARLEGFALRATV